MLVILYAARWPLLQHGALVHALMVGVAGETVPSVLPVSNTRIFLSCPSPGDITRMAQPWGIIDVRYCPPEPLRLPGTTARRTARTPLSTQLPRITCTPPLLPSPRVMHPRLSRFWTDQKRDTPAPSAVDIPPGPVGNQHPIRHPHPSCLTTSHHSPDLLRKIRLAVPTQCTFASRNTETLLPR